MSFSQEVVINGFSKTPVNYVSVTIDFILHCANISGYNPKEEGTLKAVLYLLGFQVEEPDEKGNIVSSHIDRLYSVNVRCKDRPYMYRKTTVYSGRLRKDFKYGRIYDKVDILDVGSIPENLAAMVCDLPYDLPSVEKVNTRKYTKKENRQEGLAENTDIVSEINL